MNGPSQTRQKRVTVIDVARAAGVSPGTVSNAISGKRKVDAETRKRIETAIRDLGYVPNLAARRMRTGRTNTIAIFSSMPVAVAAGSSRLGFLMEIAASAAVTALDHNTALALIPPIEDPLKVFDTIPMDGALIVEPETDDPVLGQLSRRGIPTVAIGGAPGTPGARVDLDYRAMATLLIDHLFAAGATRFPLVVGQSARQTNIVFKEVYRERAGLAGMIPRILEVPELTAETGAAEAIASEILKGQDMDGVLVPIDAMATGVMKALRQYYLRVPADVRVVTRYDGLRARSEAPPLTAINLHLDEVATIATRALVTFIETGQPPEVAAGPAPQLVLRGSSRGQARYTNGPRD